MAPADNSSDGKGISEVSLFLPFICLAFPPIAEVICFAVATDSFLGNRAIISNIHYGIEASGSPENFLALDLIRNTKASYLMGQGLTADYHTLAKDRYSVTAPTIEASGTKRPPGSQHHRYDLAAITT